MWRNQDQVLLCLVCVTSVVFIKCQFFDCHDDPGYNPDEGALVDLQFTWLGALQYIHVKNGTPHYFRVPRVVLISRQFVLSTAMDAAQIPVGYALGNIVFGDYERDEDECRISTEQVAAGIECEPAILLMPIADVLLHPEYKHFGAKYSIALMKLITNVKSQYMLPACLPFKNYLIDENGKLTRAKLFHVDFSSGGNLCPDPLRSRRPPPPPHHIMIYPYVPWITAAITGKAVGAFAKDDPFGFIMPRASIYDQVAHGWLGHWWMGGLRCYDRGEAADDMFKFYHEIFQIKPTTETFATYYLEIDAAHDTMIICVKVGMPYKLGKPRVWELDTPIVKIRVPMIRFYYQYRFQIEAWAYNTSDIESSTEESSTTESLDTDEKQDLVKRRRDSRPLVP